MLISPKQTNNNVKQISPLTRFVHRSWDTRPVRDIVLNSSRRIYWAVMTSVVEEDTGAYDVGQQYPFRSPTPLSLDWPLSEADRQGRYLQLTLLK